jgi:hypothetical protein
MKQTIFEKNGGTYIEVNGCQVPCLLSSLDGQQQHIGAWGQRHLRYLRQHRRATYVNLKTTGKLRDYLTEIDQQAQAMFVQMVKQMAAQEGATEQLKESNQMAWVQKMNQITACTTEIINVELIYT